jgi:ATP-dependent helicase STH1/SNF2
MLARTDEDLVVFARIDRERRERQQAAWRAAGQRGDAPRLLTIDEIPRAWLEKAVPREVLQQQEFESHGRGQRKQAVRRVG